MKQQFTILGIPKAQGRPRFARMGKYVKTYDPKDSRVYKENVAAQIVSQKPDYISEGPIVIELTFRLPRPKSLKKSIVHHVKKPDLDNLSKAIMDASKGILWRDDSQVISLTAAKEYTLEQPMTLIEVDTVEESALKLAGV